MTDSSTGARLRTETITEYGRTTQVTPIRTFKSTNRTLGVGFDTGSYFVYDKGGDEPFSKHCGPYSTSEQAEDWINAIREESR